MEAVKRKNALRSGNSCKAKAKKGCKKSIARKSASVNEVIGLIMFGLGSVAMFGRWENHTAQIIGSTVAILLLVVGTVVMLGGKE